MTDVLRGRGAAQPKAAAARSLVARSPSAKAGATRARSTSTARLRSASRSKLSESLSTFETLPRPAPSRSRPSSAKSLASPRAASQASLGAPRPTSGREDRQVEALHPAAGAAWECRPRPVSGLQWRDPTPGDLAVDQELQSASSLPEGAKAVAASWVPLRAAVELGPYVWDVNVRLVQTPGANKLALCMHGHGGYCNLACWSPFWPSLVEQGYHILAFDSPGYGRSSGMTNQTIKWKQYDQDLVLRLLAGIGVPAGSGCVTVFGQCMGGAMFLRAFCKCSAVFGPFHVLHNCTIGTWPQELPNLLAAKGGGLFAFWEADPDHMRESNVFREFSNLMATQPELCTFLDLSADSSRYPRLSSCCACLGMSRGEQSVEPGTGDGSYLMEPTGGLLEDVLAFLARLPRRRLALPSAPVESALQRGVPSKGMRVFVRARPPISRELGIATCVRVAPLAGWEPLELWEGPPPDEVTVAGRSWAFDRVFQGEASQAEVYNAVGQPIVQSVLVGRNGCILAYGQTGSGKTFTISGDSDNDGIVPRAVRDIFAGLPSGASVSASYVQLYNDTLLDLFRPEVGSLHVADDAAFGGGAVVVGGTVLETRTSDELLAAVKQGAQFRTSGKTNMNEASSRSHALLTLFLADPPRVFHLVDLAGSERVKRSLATGGRLEEAIAINSSLLALGNVVAALVELNGKPRAHIPYRDSILTRLLRSALGGDARTALVACISPTEDSADETVNCLRFAAHATFIRNDLGKDAEEDETVLPEQEAEKLQAKGNSPQIDAEGWTTIPACGIDISCCAHCGEGRGAPLVIFLHHYGFGATGRWWSNMFEDVVAAGGRYLAPSFPGHGRTPGTSSSKAEDLGKAGCAVEIVKGLMDWLGAGQAILVGYDWGGGIAAEFAVTYPRRVKYLALWCMSYRDETRLQKLAKRGKDICYMWDKDDLNRSEKKGRAFAKAMQAKYIEYDRAALSVKLRRFVESSRG